MENIYYAIRNFVAQMNGIDSEDHNVETLAYDVFVQQDKLFNTKFAIHCKNKGYAIKPCLTKERLSSKVVFLCNMLNKFILWLNPNISPKYFFGGDDIVVDTVLESIVKKFNDVHETIQDIGNAAQKHDEKIFNFLKDTGGISDQGAKDSNDTLLENLQTEIQCSLASDKQHKQVIHPKRIYCEIKNLNQEVNVFIPCYIDSIMSNDSIKNTMDKYKIKPIYIKRKRLVKEEKGAVIYLSQPYNSMTCLKIPIKIAYKFIKTLKEKNQKTQFSGNSYNLCIRSIIGQMSNIQANRSTTINEIQQKFFDDHQMKLSATTQRKYKTIWSGQELPSYLNISQCHFKATTTLHICMPRTLPAAFYDPTHPSGCVA